MSKELSDFAKSAPAGEREAWLTSIANRLQALCENSLRGKAAAEVREVWRDLSGMLAAWQRTQSVPCREGFTTIDDMHAVLNRHLVVADERTDCAIIYRVTFDTIRAIYDEGRTQSAGVPDGWRMVPEEPTEGMIDAGCREHTCVQGDSWYSDSEISEHDAIAVFKAMLAAVPAQQAAHDQGERYTCIGKGGSYELVGYARLAGELRDMIGGFVPDLAIYRSETDYFARTRQDFKERMEPINAASTGQEV